MMFSSLQKCIDSNHCKMLNFSADWATLETHSKETVLLCSLQRKWGFIEFLGAWWRHILRHHVFNVFFLSQQWKKVDVWKFPCEQSYLRPKQIRPKFSFAVRWRHNDVFTESHMENSWLTQKFRAFECGFLSAELPLSKYGHVTWARFRILKYRYFRLIFPLNFKSSHQIWYCLCILNKDYSIFPQKGEIALPQMWNRVKPKCCQKLTKMMWLPRTDKLRYIFCDSEKISKNYIITWPPIVSCTEKTHQGVDMKWLFTRFPGYSTLEMENYQNYGHFVNRHFNFQRFQQKSLITLKYIDQ